MPQKTQVLAMVNESTFIGHRKYFRFFAHFCGNDFALQLCSLLKFHMY